MQTIEASRTQACIKTIAGQKPGPYAWYGLGVLCLATLFGFIDRQLIVLVVDPVKEDLNLQDSHIGTILGLAPGIALISASVPIAWLADRFDRRKVLAICVLCWSAATAACGLAVDFTTLFFASMAIVLGEAALAPIIYSLIPELFPSESRIRANFVFYAACLVGAGVGLMGGGAIISFIDLHGDFLRIFAGDVSNWRYAFFLVAIPGPLIAALVLTVRTKHAALRSGESITAGLRAFSNYLKMNAATFSTVALGLAFSSFSLLATSSWLPATISRTLNQPPAIVGTALGFANILGALAGVGLAATTTGLWVRIAGVRFGLRGLQVFTLLQLIPLILLAFAQSPNQAYVLGGCYFLFGVAAGALTPAVLQDIASPQLRARIIALATTVYFSIGSLGPMTVGFLSTVRESSNALLVSFVFAAGLAQLISVLFFWLAEKPFQKTVAAIQGAQT